MYYVLRKLYHIFGEEYSKKKQVDTKSTRVLKNQIINRIRKTMGKKRGTNTTTRTRSTH